MEKKKERRIDFLLSARTEWERENDKFSTRSDE